MAEVMVEARGMARPSAVWIIPVIALALGIWLVIDTYLSQGPKVEITFQSAEGIIAGETTVKRLSVELGVVEEVYLNPGFSDVTVVLQLDEGTNELLRDDTQFWVVRPRVGASGVTGLSTLLSGAYIELAPGSSPNGRVEFAGMEEAPITPITTPGLRLRLKSDASSLLAVGSPVLYNGFQVGRVEESYLSIEDGERYYRLFIDAPYHDLVNSNTRFWNAGGINVDAGTEGISVRVESLEALLSGGVSFGLPQGQSFGQGIQSDHEFFLYSTADAINEQPYEFSLQYLLLFNASVRGLEAGAPVEYRGIRLGTVLDVSFDVLATNSNITIDGRTLMPVLIQIDPGRVFGEDSEQVLSELEATITNGVNNGLRASLVSGNLLTGSLYVTLDFYDEVETAEITQQSGYSVLPTISTGLDQLQQQVTQILTKFQSLPIEETLSSATAALESVRSTVSTADQTLSDVSVVLQNPDTVALPGQVESALSELTAVLDGIAPGSAIYTELDSALDELRETLRNARDLTSTLEAQPSSLIFPSTAREDLIPGSTAQ